MRGADRAVLVCDRLRPVLPLLLAISANSPFLDGRDSGLHSARSQIFTKSFPRCGVPDAFGRWQAFADYIDFLVRTRSIVEYTQVWWSIRPHFSFGTVEVRICDAQMTAAESEALAALIVACVAQAARDHDDGVPFADLPRRLIEENVWRAIRHGLDGELLDLDRAEPYPAAEAAERLLSWSAPVRAELGIDVGAALAERRAAPAADDRRRTDPARGLRRGRGRDARHLCGERSGGDPMSSEPRQPSEEELRAAYEAELKRLRVEHVLLDNVAALATSACAGPAWPRAPRTNATRPRSASRSSRSAR